MYRIRAILNNEQVQAIEYENLQQGLSTMSELYPECILEHDDIAEEIKLYNENIKKYKENLVNKNGAL
jgi:hypothetical protein